MPPVPNAIRGILKAIAVVAVAAAAGIGLGSGLSAISGDKGENSPTSFTATDAGKNPRPIGATGASGTSGPSTGGADATPNFRVTSARLTLEPGAGGRKRRAGRVAIGLRGAAGSEPILARPRLLAGFTRRPSGPSDVETSALRIPANTKAARILRFKTAGKLTDTLKRTRRATLRIGKTSLPVLLTDGP